MCVNIKADVGKFNQQKEFSIIVDIDSIMDKYNPLHDKNQIDYNFRNRHNIYSILDYAEKEANIVYVEFTEDALIQGRLSIYPAEQLQFTNIAPLHQGDYNDYDKKLIYKTLIGKNLFVLNHVFQMSNFLFIFLLFFLHISLIRQIK